MLPPVAEFLAAPWPSTGTPPLGRGSLLLHASRAAPVFAEEAPWWSKDGLRFSCTECGKCCRVVGDVWMSQEEVSAAAALLDLGLLEFKEAFVAETVESWVRLNDRENAVGGESCCFLEDDGKTCGIYEARPLQCRTYPWWPRLLRSKEAWEAEAAVPDDAVGRHWTPEDGGCEGIRSDAALVPPAEIRMNAEMHAARARRFPTGALWLATVSTDESPSSDGGEAAAEVELEMEGAEAGGGAPSVPRAEAALAVAATRAWVKDVVIALRLCPFAEGVFASNSVRYAVTGATAGSQMVRTVLAEAATLLRAPEELVATTLIVAPLFLPSDFLAFHEFSTWLEDLFESFEALGDSIMLVCFHPKHEFAGLDADDPLHYEKRSPHPTINLLRAPQVDEYAAAGRTQDIGEKNRIALEREGTAAVRSAFEAAVAAGSAGVGRCTKGGLSAAAPP